MPVGEAGMSLEVEDKGNKGEKPVEVADKGKEEDKMEAAPELLPVVEKAGETPSEETQLFLKWKNHVSCGFNWKYCPGNCMFCCAKDMVEVALPDGEKVWWPKRVAIVGYPTMRYIQARPKRFR
jgi:hypothetical protein